MLKRLSNIINNSSGESSLELLVFMFKILVVTLLIFQLSIFIIDTSKYYIVVNETIRKAQAEGVIRRDYFESQLLRFNIQPSSVRTSASPGFDTYVKKLGDQLTIRVQYDFSISFTDLWSVELPITIKASKTNQGFYGEGYGGGW